MRMQSGDSSTTQSSLGQLRFRRRQLKGSRPQRHTGCYAGPAAPIRGARRWRMTSSRRAFLSSAVGAVGASALAAQQRGGAAVPHSRISPMDGVRREKIRITGVKIISLGYRLKPEEEWPDGDDNVIIYKTESVIVELTTDVGLKGIGGASRYNGPAEMKEYAEADTLVLGC